jgi:phage terminase large subunit-like protein
LLSDKPSSSWPPRWLTPVPQEAIDAGDGKYAIEFAEAFGTIGKDGIAGRTGEALRLRPWQKELVKRIFARDANGGLRAQVALVGTPRKSGKSALASTLALYSLIAEGIEGGEVVVAAAEKEQARIIFGEAKRMVEASELSELCTLYRDAIFVPSTNSVMKVLSAEAYSKEGLNVSRAIVDEIHAHKNRELFDVLSLSMGNRGKLAQLLAVTTAGQKQDMTGQDSIAYSLYQYGKRVSTGEIDDPTFFMSWWEAEPEADHRLETTWESANPGYNDLVSKDDFASAVNRTPEPEFRTKRLNQWVSSLNAWLPNGKWEQLNADIQLDPDQPVIVGFDGSYNNDCTALTYCTIPSDDNLPHIGVIRVWEKQPEDSDEWVVSNAEVEDEIIQFCQKYNVKEIACDPYRWQRTMEALQEQGFPIVEYNSGSPSRMVPACQKVFQAVTEGNLTHDGNPTLARHLSNTVIKVDRLGPRIVKEHRGSPRKIDAAVAAVIAFDRATVGRVEDEQLSPQFFI